MRLCVEDHGIGIPREDQQHLFELFFRGMNANDIGLGLHIVRKYTELMNGKIECYSETGKGTRFVLEIKMNG